MTGHQFPSLDMISSAIIFCAFCPSSVPKFVTSSVTIWFTHRDRNTKVAQSVVGKHIPQR